MTADQGREKLIEESFKAHEDAPTWQDDPVARDAAIRWHMRGFNDALAVFEKAPAPTGDDRKAMLESIQAGMDYYAREDIPEDGLSEAEQIADFLIDAGFRRPEGPEPQREPTDAQVKAALDAWVSGDFFALYPTSVPYWEPKMRAALRASAKVQP